MMQALAEKERQLSEAVTAVSPFDQRRWSHPGSADGRVAPDEKPEKSTEMSKGITSKGCNTQGETPRGRSFSGAACLRHRTRERDRRQRRMRRRSGGDMVPLTATSPLQLKSGHVVARRLRFGSSSSSGTAGSRCSSERRRRILRGLQGTSMAHVRGYTGMGDDVEGGNVNCVKREEEIDGDDELGEWEEEEEGEFDDGRISLRRVRAALD